jgi:hypothetical protein
MSSMGLMGLMGFYDEAVPCVFAKLKAEAISLLLDVFYGLIGWMGFYDEN